MLKRRSAPVARDMKIVKDVSGITASSHGKGVAT
jgi:hypothetical protein